MLPLVRAAQPQTDEPLKLLKHGFLWKLPFTRPASFQFQSQKQQAMWVQLGLWNPGSASVTEVDVLHVCNGRVYWALSAISVLFIVWPARSNNVNALSQRSPRSGLVFIDLKSRAEGKKKHIFMALNLGKLHCRLIKKNNLTWLVLLATWPQHRAADVFWLWEYVEESTMISFKCYDWKEEKKKCNLQ